MLIAFSAAYSALVASLHLNDFVNGRALVDNLYADPPNEGVNAIMDLLRTLTHQAIDAHEKGIHVIDGGKVD